jgi:glycosyltransferase involved in cell wall biosynthesis
LSGIPELIEDGVEGRLAEPGDPVTLAEAIARAIEDPGTSRSMAARARDKVRLRHELSAQVAEFAEALRSVAG